MPPNAVLTASEERVQDAFGNEGSIPSVVYVEGRFMYLNSARSSGSARHSGWQSSDMSYLVGQV